MSKKKKKKVARITKKNHVVHTDVHPKHIVKFTKNNDIIKKENPRWTAKQKKLAEESEKTKEAKEVELV